MDAVSLETPLLEALAMPLIRRQILLILYGALVLVLAGLYFMSYPAPGVFPRLVLVRLREAASVLVFGLVALGAGSRILRAAGIPTSPSERVFWSFGLGAPALAFGVLGLGLCGALNKTGLLVLTLVLAIVSWKDVRTWAAAGLQSGGRLLNRRLSVAHGLLSAGVAAVVGLAALCALAPPTYYDSLVYHLALPAKYLQEGRVGFVPYNHYSHFPQNMEMIFAWFLALGDDVSAQLFCVALAALTGGYLYRAGRDLCRLEGFRWDVLLFVSAPCVVLLASETYVEAGLAYWTLLAVAAAARGGLEKDRAWLALSGVMGGFAAGIKYTGVLTPLILAAFVLFRPRAGRLGRRLADAFLIGGPAFLMFLPWMIKNFVFTGGNPVFPFLPNLFPARRVYMFRESAEAYFQVFSEYRGSSAFINEILLMPFRLASRVTSFGGGFDVTGDLGWALPLFLLPLVFLSPLVKDRTRGSYVRFFLGYTVVHGLLWAGFRPVLRFLYPVFPLVCWLAGLGFQALLASSSLRIRRFATTVLWLFILSNAMLFYWVENVRDPFPAAWGVLNRDAYLSRKIQAYPAWKFVNETLPPASQVLAVGDQRGYYIQRPYVAPMALLPSPLRDWADQAGDGPGLKQKLRDLGFTHLLFNRREALRLEGYQVLDLTDRGRQAWNQMLAGLPALYDTDDVAVYRLE
jgi:hypothetical protein